MINNSILYPFQQQLLDQSNKNYYYSCDTGTGKTLISIHHYLKHSNGEPLLIVAPPAKIKEGGWDREITFVENKYNIKIYYQTLSYGMLAKKWMLYKGHFVIFDEAHYIKASTSSRGKCALSLTRIATGFTLLSATPMSNGWQDSVNYMLMFDKFNNKTHMMREHAVYETQHYGGRSFKKIVDWKNKEQLTNYWKSFAVSIKKDEALELPPLVMQKVYFKPSKDYLTVKKDRVLNNVAFDTPAKLLAGLRYYTNQKAKAEYLQMLLESTRDNVVVFYQFKKEYEILTNICKALNKKFYTVNGQEFHLPKQKTANSVTMVQYQAGSAGIELQYANVVVFYTPTYSYQDYSQALGRAYRNGQTRKVTVYQFNTEQTIEEDVWFALDHKKDFSEKRYLETRFKIAS